MVDNDKVTLFNGFILDRVRGCLMQESQPIHLRPQSYRVLEYLIENSGRLISKDNLVAVVWEGRAVTDGAVGKCIEELRSVFGEEGRQYLRNVRGRGYIFDRDPQAQIRETETEELNMVRVIVEERNGDAHAAVKHVDTKARSSWRSAATFVGIAFVLVAAIVGVYWAFSVRQPASNITSIAVLPLKNESGNSDVDYLSDGMTESLINSLSRLPGLAVKAHSSVFQYKGKDVDVRKIASELSAQTILTGRFVQRGDDITLYVALIDGQTGNQIWGEQYDRKSDQLALLQREATTDIAQRLNAKLELADRQQLARGSTQNNEAYRAYLKGRYYWSGRGGAYHKSREFFQQAIDLDPTYALGHAGLGHYYGFAAALGMASPDENWKRSEAAIKKALELDDSLAENYNAMAGVQLYYYRDWTAAERSFKRGIELNPASAEVRHHYARCLTLFGRKDEAIDQIQRTLELDPLSIMYNLNAGRIFFFLGQYSRAIDQLNNTLEIEPNSPAVYDTLGSVYEQMGNESAAIAAWSKMRSLTHNDELAAKLQSTYEHSGFVAAVRLRTEAQLKVLDERVKRGEYVPAIEYVTAYTRLGDKEKAFAWLEKATQERNRFAIEFKSNPLYEKLRSDPRFQQLADKVKVV